MGARTLRPGVVEFDMKHRCNGTSPNSYQDNGKYKTDAKNIKISPYRYKAYADDIPGPGAYNDENSTRYGKMKGPQITIGNKFSQNQLDSNQVSPASYDVRPTVDKRISITFKQRTKGFVVQ